MHDSRSTTQEGLEKLRTRLLDLTNRNKLINYTARSGSSIRIVQASPSKIWEALVNGKKLPFDVVPEPGDERTDRIRGLKPAARDHAKNLNWNISFDLDPVGGSTLRVLYYAEEFDALARKVATTARTAVEESGTNMLYLVFGFLEWFESDSSDKAHHAPLCLLPVTIERHRPTAGGQINIRLEYTGEDVTSNLSLVEKMRRDFNIELPVQNDDETPTEYFARIRQAIRSKPRWQIKNWLTVGFFTFGKLLMYKDLDPRNWPAALSLDQHVLVKQLFEGTGVAGTNFAPEHDIDAAESTGNCPLLVYDADSSQHSAIIDVRNGRNLVIEGPPGTGKSQTITNIIAGALAEAKTVLFVAEKLAALEVVRKRLDEAGLGTFCLELHSHKTQKQALIADIARRVAAGDSFSAPKDLGHSRKELEQLKQRIGEYARFLAQKHPKLQRSYYELLWMRQRWLLQIDDGVLSKELEGSIASADDRDRVDFERMRLDAQVYAKSLQSACPGATTPLNHPWAWLEHLNLDIPGQARLIRQLTQHHQLIEKALSVADTAHPVVTLRAGESLVDQLQSLSRISEHMPARPPACPSTLLQASHNRKVRALLEEWLALQISTDTSHQQLMVDLVDVYALLNESNSITAAVADAVRLEVSHCTRRDLDEHLASAAGKLRCLTEVRTLLAPALAPESKADFQQVDILCDCVRDLTPEIISRRNSVLAAPDALSTVQSARKQAEELKLQRSQLEREFDLRHLPPVSQIRAAFEIISGAGWWSKWFGSEYKTARALYARLRLDLKVAPQHTMAQQLRDLAAWSEQLSDFEGNERFRVLTGEAFTGIDAPWQELEIVSTWLQKVNTLLPAESRYGAFARDADPPQLLALSKAAAEVQAAAVALSAHMQDAECVSEWEQDLRNFVNDLNTIQKTLRRATIKDQVVVAQLSTTCERAHEWKSSTSLLQASTRRVLELGFDEHNLTVTNINTALEFLRNAHSCPLWEDHSQLLADSWDDIRLTLTRIAQSSAEFAAELAASALTLANVSSAEPCEFLPRVGDDLQTNIERSLAHTDLLRAWCDFLDARRKLKAQGAERFVEVIEKCGDLHPIDVLFQFAFFDSATRPLFTANRHFHEFRGIELSELRRRFCELDQQLLTLNRAQIAHRASCRPLPWGNNSGSVKDYTEMSLIVHEISKQKRHVPIRKLVTQAGKALMALKPCFMMGPLSVSQYLPPAEISFDLVVMDEASQLKPEDAIGCIARAKQVIVVGDPKQLPPTSFFDRMDEEPEEEDVVKFNFTGIGRLYRSSVVSSKGSLRCTGTGRRQRQHQCSTDRKSLLRSVPT